MVGIVPPDVLPPPPTVCTSPLGPSDVELPSPGTALPKNAVAVDAALNAAVRVLNGGGLDARRRQELEVPSFGVELLTKLAGGGGVRLLESENELRLGVKDSGAVTDGAGDGVKEMGAEDAGVDERWLDASLDVRASNVEGPGPGVESVSAETSASPG